MSMKRDDELEIFPVVHNNVFYNVITNIDLELAELREMLDWIQQNRIIEEQMQQHPDMPAICEIDLTRARIVADVMNYEILIYRREERHG